ncbi:LapA family protein [Pelobacter seleniigenes]|uniref:LapA family protein n=1 Tax=Pelobacter seleniigenes TaxID=407188 RepID=UPI0004A6F42B|nr:LapA family protein [Pelobacter seleniigenes]
MKGKLIAGLVLLVPVLIFAVQNSAPITVTFLQWEFAVPLALLVYASLVIGIVLGVLFSYVGRVRKNRKEKRKQQEAMDLPKKAEQNSTMPTPSANGISATVDASTSFPEEEKNASK